MAKKYTLKRRVANIAKTMISLLGIQSSLQAELNAMKKLLVDKSIITQEELDATIDSEIERYNTEVETGDIVDGDN